MWFAPKRMELWRSGFELARRDSRMRSVIQAYIHPFKRIGVALLDMLFLLNVITLTLGTLYTIQNDNRFSDQENLVNASVSITFICFIGIVLWHLLKRLRNNVRIRNKTDQMLASATRVVLGVKQGSKPLWHAIRRRRKMKRNCRVGSIVPNTLSQLFPQLEQLQYLSRTWWQLQMTVGHDHQPCLNWGSLLWTL